MRYRGEAPSVPAQLWEDVGLSPRADERGVSPLTVLVQMLQAGPSPGAGVGSAGSGGLHSRSEHSSFATAGRATTPTVRVTLAGSSTNLPCSAPSVPDYVPGLGSPSHVCTGTGPAPATSAPRLHATLGAPQVDHMYDVPGSCCPSQSTASGSGCRSRTGPRPAVPASHSSEAGGLHLRLSYAPPAGCGAPGVCGACSAAPRQATARDARSQQEPPRPKSVQWLGW
jgi:hypothetical protein